MLDRFGLEGVKSIHAEITIFFLYCGATWRVFDPCRDHAFSLRFCFVIFLYDIHDPDTTDDKRHMSSTDHVLHPAGYDAVHDCRQPAED